MDKYLPYAVLCGAVSIIFYFISTWVCYITGALCCIYFFIYFVLVKDKD